MVAETRKTNNRDLSPSKLMIPPPPPRHLLYNRGVCRVDDFRIFAIFIKKLYSTVVGPTKVLLGLLLFACDDDYNILYIGVNTVWDGDNNLLLLVVAHRPSETVRVHKNYHIVVGVLINK